MKSNRIEAWLQRIGQFIARLALGYLFFTQLWWKVPPSFGCPPDFAFTQEVGGQLKTSSGLCDWIGRESVYARQPRQFFVADLHSVGGPTLALDVGLIARANGAFLADRFGNADSDLHLPDHTD